MLDGGMGHARRWIVPWPRETSVLPGVGSLLPRRGSDPYATMTWAIVDTGKVIADDGSIHSRRRTCLFYGHVSPQIELTWLTQMESHSVLQQYASFAQISFAHALQELFSLAPESQMACLQVPPPPPPPPPPHDSPQIEVTCPTQMESHSTSQQYGSAAQMSPAHVLQVLVSVEPSSQMLCAQPEGGGGPASTGGGGGGGPASTGGGGPASTGGGGGGVVPPEMAAPSGVPQPVGPS
jgi:uncharacterized membrane protein YgcG